MPNRLLSLLTEIEQALIANDPSPDGGVWETSRLINFHQGLARLTLSVRTATGSVVARGSILAQNFTLADGTLCLKANLSWQGTDNTAVAAIYSKPETKWRLEASQIAIKWLDGHLSLAEARELSQGNSASPLEKATG